MHYVADVWFYWCVIAVGIVAVKYAGQSWGARTAKKARERQDRAYRSLLDDLVAGNIGDIASLTPMIEMRPHGSELVWHMDERPVTEAAHILSQSFKREVA
jgi:hypothetical protein